MDVAQIKKIADAVLYEGYLLYPYRPSAIKNQQRFNFGVLYPQVYGVEKQEPYLMQTECLVTGNDTTTIKIKVRFLHLLMREADSENPGWQEAAEQEVNTAEFNLRALCTETQQNNFFFPASLDTDSQGFTRRQEALTGQINLAAEAVEETLFKLSVQLLNLTPFTHAAAQNREKVLLSSLVSTHKILSTQYGEFISLLDPPEAYRAAPATCHNHGTFPVLVGEEGDSDAMLSSPIILYDYPQIAPESAGDLFDGTEIDEILTLRILTLTEEEKQEIYASDKRARQLLERSEALPAEHLMKMHSVLRG